MFQLFRGFQVVSQSATYRFQFLPSVQNEERGVKGVLNNVKDKVGHPLFSKSNNTSDTSDTSNTRNAHVKQVFTSNTSNTIIASNAGDASYSSDASKTSNARCKSLNASQ